MPHQQVWRARSPGVLRQRAARFGRHRTGLPWNPFKALVAPRPIGWISTLGPGGVVNLAPFSYFHAASDRPDVVMFSAELQILVADGALAPSDDRKDSEDNANSLGSSSATSSAGTYGRR